MSNQENMNIKQYQQNQDKQQINNFEALKQYQQVEHQANTLKNRINVLETKNQKNIKKIQNSKQKLQQLTNIRQNIAKQNLQAEQYKKIHQEQLHKKTQNNKIAKSLHKQIIKKNNQKIIVEKVQVYTKTRKQHQTNEKRISQQRQKHIQQKKNKHNKVISQQNQSRILINDYKYRKNNSIHQNLEKQKNFIHKKQTLREKQLNALARKQMELLQKQSESQSAYKQMKNKLDKMLGKIRLQNKNKKQSFMGVQSSKLKSTHNNQK